MLPGPSWARASITASLIAALVTLITLAGPAQPAAAAVACTTPNPGEMTLYWLDVEQGDGQLLIGPTGKTLLIDLGETAWNSTGAGTNAARYESNRDDGSEEWVPAAALREVGAR